MEIQVISEDELKNKLVSGHWAKIRTRQYTEIINNKTRAAKVKGGWSYIISFYDNKTYICTIHRIIDKRRKIVHEHPKRAVIDGVDYTTT
jgi:protoheme ferro-lyase